MDLERHHEPHVVYQFVNAAARPLYVGVSIDFKSRRSAHRRKPWQADVADLLVEHFPDRPSALARERDLLLRYRPVGNIKDGPTRPHLLYDPTTLAGLLGATG